jgi:pyruvate formate lyase activating enzyme
MTRLVFAGAVPTSLIDFPGHVATTVFTHGCNLHCGYCHNPLLVEGPPPERPLGADDAIALLERRRRLVGHVCVTGGEPTLHPGLIAFLAVLKERGMGVKLDTNGGRPDVVAQVLRRGLCDYIAMDLKTAWQRYAEIGARDPAPFRQTVELIRAEAPDYEFRTTVAPGLVEEADVFAIAASIRGARRYIMQQFSGRGRMLDPAWSGVRPHPAAALRAWAGSMDGWFQEPVQVRNA